MATRANDIEKASYQVIAYPAKYLPDNYRNMILSKWMRSLRNGNDYFKIIDAKSYYKTYQKYVKLLLEKPNSIVRLAVLSDEHDVVLGWSLVEDTVLHYVWIQVDSRGLGIGKNLVPTEITAFTHYTKHIAPIWNKKYKTVIFNPFY